MKKLFLMLLSSLFFMGGLIARDFTIYNFHNTSYDVEYYYLDLLWNLQKQRIPDLKPGQHATMSTPALNAIDHIMLKKHDDPDTEGSWFWGFPALIVDKVKIIPYSERNSNKSATVAYISLGDKV